MRVSLQNLKCVWLWLGICLHAASAHATSAVSSQASTPQIHARLLSSHQTVAAGERITLAVALDIAPHWHTYWRNPGDSGTVTTLQWQFSHPAKVGEVQWPMPDRFQMGPIVNYGYAHQLTLPVQLQLPADLKAGEKLRAQTKVDWLVCREECIPQQVILALRLPVVATGQSKQRVVPEIMQALQQQPVQNQWPVSLQQRSGWLDLHIAAPQLADGNVTELWFYPSQWGWIAQSAPQRVLPESNGVTLHMKAGDQPLQAGQSLQGVLIIKRQQGSTMRRDAVTLDVPLTRPPVRPASSALNHAQTHALTLLWAVWLAFVGGLILNLMPCVFPVLSIKALSLLKHADAGSRVLLRQSLLYTVGVVSSFVALALLLVLLKAGGAQVGWGFQFQSPWFVFAMTYLLFAVGLNLSGVYEIGGGLSGVGGQLAEQGGDWGSFFTGVLATIVATPCTAPFMAAALGFALSRPGPELVLIFISLGLGLAAPYVLLASWPALQRSLPRPGAWMEYTRQLFAFPMYAASVWLIWVLARQAGDVAVVLVLSGLVLLALAAWLYGLHQSLGASRQPWLQGLAVMVLLSATSLVSMLPAPGEGTPPSSASNAQAQPASTEPQHGQHWHAYTPARLQQLLAEGKPVFLNLTAAWCISCLVNEKVVLSQPAVLQAFAQQGITPLKGDWTNKDAEITRLINAFGRSGVPLYVFYSGKPGVAPLPLPQILTPDIVLAYIQHPQGERK